MDMFLSYNEKKCKNCKYLITRKKIFSKKLVYGCSLQIGSRLENINLFYCCLYKKRRS